MRSVTRAAAVAPVTLPSWLMILDECFTRLAGILGLFAFIVARVLAIATPAFLEDEVEQE